MGLDDYYEEIMQECKKFWEQMGKNLGYIGDDCPNCGRQRVQRWECGKDICEKCYWCIQDNGYFDNEFFNL